MRAVLSGEKGAKRDMVLLNAGAALGKIKGRAALEALLRLIGDEHPQVREVITSYVAQFRSPRVMPALKARLKDDNAKVRKMAKSWIDNLEEN